jgi:hypothetical protein
VQDSQLGFLRFNELADGQGDLALSLEYDSTFQHLSIEACAPLPQDTKPVDLAAAYLSLCDLNSSSLCSYFASDSDTPLDSASAQLRLCALAYTILDARTLLAIFAGKKYKPVALKVRPVETELPSQFQVGSASCATSRATPSKTSHCFQHILHLIS